jgi:hypothetical protein
VSKLTLEYALYWQRDYNVKELSVMIDLPFPECGMQHFHIFAQVG